MDQLPYVVVYTAFAVSVVSCCLRVVMWARLPMHVRWELYPVAHEAERSRYGGSYLEESDWWKQPRRVSLWGELKVMVPEILFLVALREHNRKMWLRSFPFHFGLYLTIGATGLALGTGGLQRLAPAALSAGRSGLLQGSVVVIGAAGLGLALLGAVALLHRRLTAPELRDFTSAADLFNLGFFIVAFGCSLLTFALVDPTGADALRFAGNLVSFDLAPMPGAGLGAWLRVASVLLLSGLVAYVPLTHMSHFIGKYFAYHAIRWNDAPNLPGGKQEAAIRALLGRPVSWAAPHIGGDGKKSWADVATSSGPEQNRK
jgi:nitrate reductase gamma subunit